MYSFAVLHHVVEPPTVKATLGEMVPVGARRFCAHNVVVARRPRSQ